MMRAYSGSYACCDKLSCKDIISYVPTTSFTNMSYEWMELKYAYYIFKSYAGSTKAQADGGAA